MKRKRDSIADMLSCQVCFEDFDEDGDHIPRIFPCSHTVCVSCIKNLIKNDKLACPECRKTYEVDNVETSFPQNKYLLVQIRSGKIIKHEEADSNERCKEHGKELTAFCKVCQKDICISCLKKGHEGHEWIEIEDWERETLTEEVTKTM